MFSCETHREHVKLAEVSLKNISHFISITLSKRRTLFTLSLSFSLFISPDGNSLRFLSFRDYSQDMARPHIRMKNSHVSLSLSLFSLIAHLLFRGVMSRESATMPFFTCPSYIIALTNASRPRGRQDRRQFVRP